MGLGADQCSQIIPVARTVLGCVGSDSGQVAMIQVAMIQVDVQKAFDRVHHDAISAV